MEKAPSQFPRALLAVVLLLCGLTPSLATTRYVDPNNPNPHSPYNSWSKAATDIQTAVDSATAGDVVLVTNGFFQTGVHVVGADTNRVAITKAVTVSSVNGPGSTVIYGDAFIRCAYIASGATLTGFTLTNGSGLFLGSGAYCESGGVITNCTLIGNSAQSQGGGIYGGKAINCSISIGAA